MEFSKPGSNELSGSGILKRARDFDPGATNNAVITRGEGRTVDGGGERKAYGCYENK